MSPIKSGVVNNQADLAKRYGMSRARVTQYLNLLKLPDEIINFLKTNKDKESVLRYFTERRIREFRGHGFLGSVSPEFQ